MDCPVCHNPLMVIERHQIELDCCPVCQGVWFDEDELHRLCDALPEVIRLPDITALPAAPAVRERTYRCPRCNRPMNKVLLGNHDPVVVDRCPHGDGLWLDHGELDAVVRHHRIHHDRLADEPVIEFVGELFESHESAS